MAGRNVYIDETKRFQKLLKLTLRKSEIMNTQDIIKIGHKARIETEAFINQYINDEAKRWPTICHCGPAHTGYHQAQQLRKHDIRHILLT
jgi:hypothetical protein